MCNDEIIIEMTEIPKLETGDETMASPLLMNPHEVYQSNQRVHFYCYPQLSFKDAKEKSLTFTVAHFHFAHLKPWIFLFLDWLFIQLKP